MKHSRETIQLKICFNQKLDGLRLILIDSNLKVILDEITERVDLELKKGIYQLKAYYIDYYQEYAIIADKNINMMFDLNYPCVAPILSFTTTNEHLNKNLRAASRSSYNGKRSNFLFFAAHYDKNLYTDKKPSKWLKNYSILDSDNNILFELSEQFEKTNGTFGAKFNDEQGWSTYTNRLENGMYFLKHKAGRQTRIFPFYISEEYQTQFFIRYSNQADLENCFFFYTQKTEFRTDAEEYLVLDKIQYIYKDYNNYNILTQKDRLIIREHPYLVSLLKVIHLILKANGSKATTLNEFSKSPYMFLPDILILRYPNRTFDFLPILSSLMTNYAVNRLGSDKNPRKFSTDSIIDRVIDHVQFDLFWNSFTKIDYLKLNNLLLVTSSYTFDDLEQNPFKFKIELNDDLHTQIKISQIAADLSIPFTKVSRNFGIYKSIHDEINKNSMDDPEHIG